MKIIVTAAFAVLFSLTLSAQVEGCTDITAINYNPDATIDDGSCDVHSTVITYDAELDAQIEIGTGISNLHMAIADHGPIQMGLKANLRFFSDIIPYDNNNYPAPTGYSPTSFIDPTPVEGIGRWDFIYSFDLGSYSFEDLEAFISIDFDPLDGEGQAEAYDLPLSFVLEQLNQDQLSFRQGSENLGFTYWQGLAGPVANLYDPLLPGVYDIGLRLENQGGTTLAEVAIRVVVEEPIDGCTDPLACNYDPAANLDDGSCTYSNDITDCEGNCLLDFDNDGVCDQEEVLGCTYPSASNYDPEATNDDGSCILTGGNETLCEAADFNDDGVVGIGDLLNFLTVYGQACID